jgi:nicotinamidase-related amidase
MYTLVIVDMQPDFNAANGTRVITNCLREIKQAMKDNASIIFLEYAHSGHTLAILSNATANYDKSYITTKNEDNGAPQVSKLISKHKMPHKLIKVCGVNTDCCVKCTVEGLSLRYNQTSIDVIADACHSDWYHASGLDAMKKIPNCNVRSKKGKVHV